MFRQGVTVKGLRLPSKALARALLIALVLGIVAGLHWLSSPTQGLANPENVTPVATPTVSLTPASPSTLAEPQQTGQNLVYNPSFEWSPHGASGGWYNLFGDGQSSWDNSTAHSGAYSVWSYYEYGSWHDWRTFSKIPVTPGTEYYFSVWHKADTQHPWVWAQIQFYRSYPSDSYISTQNIVIPAASAWSQYASTVQAPAESGGAEIVLRYPLTSNGNDGNGKVWWDDIYLGTAPPPADTEKPIVNWIAPVSDGQVYNVRGEVVRLEVSASDNVGVTRVLFYRWDAVNGQWIDLDNVYSAPYQMSLDTSTLNYEWNQIFTNAFDAAGNVSDRKFIWLYRNGPNPLSRVFYGIFTNTTVNLGGTVTIDIAIGTNTVSGYIDFTEYPGTSALCGAGNFTGTRNGDQVEFSFYANDPDPGCSWQRDQYFRINALLSENNMRMNGTYYAGNQQGVFQVISLDDQWALKRVRAPAAWEITRGSGDVIVAVVDSGVDTTHPFIAGRTVQGRAFCPFGLGDPNNTMPDCDIPHHYMHGTAVAGMVLAAAPGVKVMPIKIVCACAGDPFTIADGIRYAADQGAKVINISNKRSDPWWLGAPILDAITYAIVEKKAIVVTAAANSVGETGPPGSYTVTITVSGTDRSDKLWEDPGGDGSDFGPFVDISAPAVDFTIPYPGNEIRPTSGGNSLAAPLVSGAAALIWSKYPNYQSWQVETLLKSRADDIGEPGRDDKFGWGRLNIFNSVVRLPGDLDNNCIVDVADTQIITNKWHRVVNSPYQDCDDDGLITVKDIMCVVAEWGESC